MLQSHHERGGLVIVSEELDLVEVGRCVAEDEVDTVKKWLDSGEVKKPDEKDVASWERGPERQFIFVIVQPYVLAQKKSQ